MHYSYKKHSIPLCFAWTCLITKSTGQPAQPVNASESCWSMKSRHLHLPPCVNFLSFFSLFSKPSWSGAMAYCTITDCCWDKACSGNRSSKLCYWIRNKLQPCCYKAGKWIVNFFSFLWCIVPLGLTMRLMTAISTLHSSLNDTLCVL